MQPVAEVKEQEPDWVDDGTLPVDSAGSLPFFCIDAHEEHSTPGTLYFLGKVHPGLLSLSLGG